MINLSQESFKETSNGVSPSTDSHWIQETASKCEAENYVRILSHLFLTVCRTQMK